MIVIKKWSKVFLSKILQNYIFLLTVETRPQDGFNPKSEQVEAGNRIDPPPSLPIPIGTKPEAMAAAVPDELPHV